MPKLPCDTCKHRGSCLFEGLIAREVIFRWLNSEQFPGCAEYRPDYYHGVEGCYA